MSAPTWSAVDEATASLLDLIDADWRPFAEADRNTIAAAIRDDARFHSGQVHPNRVRDALAALPVFKQPKPTRVGPTYRAMTLAGYLEVDGWDVSDDSRGKNAGKPIRLYRWVGAS
ncbi:hypothetical protein [Nocardioides sp. YIM 152315]|uniref:hypothetical protein n=1 Tax=Nocardioides sp. YIM 152315 TaxID=3031760 RepID=UPI0023DBB2E0|nr:hypothetical protein [Nocardioides sp. YIM 152315]MDF1603361.1 hypothetical protein [Nocardioides sp. YIM 152315]